MKEFARSTRALLVLIVIFAISGAAAGEGKSEKGRLEGFFRVVNRDASTISLNVSHDTAGLWRTVVYTEGTVLTLRNKPASLDNLKEGVRVICAGHFDSASRLIAERIEIRTEQ